ncbi:hypothetical protein A2673_01700 [Candidatus Kaiserbacteria bacterium RIFCSPHIGHO2_01_FULL_50_13]|uniref:bAvd-like domain-containing protein n=1 Tax=Candidatus Kaiserbacteria bacterium RIFCSPLOWO2_01_FULL_50_24 TaxID=1798507 RepID=A0A1F6EMF2_9BACT|nr:MAG: hypothetical protein A2673_01700 [Candidatus Kaiserbacteria bacterium RIFCSPHIGHO2_01_FULL_50_13]OGG74834.1 MAG: hypothetical protein A3A34_00400 [Candidatus Kaiserbacteria bacterium RIFCSPLOWO2_01_FULL_50_24]OGG81417.1 MAG: hypothetical protein A3H74_03185 [Candidatus Kaiserbacteria bacterium RIFCSPLOWO2_02_FULL_51_13]
MPRSERFGIGGKIDVLLLDVAELLRFASFSRTDEKVPLLGRAIVKIDSLRFFVQLAWETKLIPDKQFEELAILIEEIGRMTGGWHKGLLSKAPLNKER